MLKPGLVAYALIPGLQRQSHEDLLRLRLAWTTSRVPGNLELQKQKCCYKNKSNNKKNMLVLTPSLTNTRTWKEGRGHRHVE